MTTTLVKELVWIAMAKITTLLPEEALQKAGSGTPYAPRGRLGIPGRPDNPCYKPGLAEAAQLMRFRALALHPALLAKVLQEMGVENVAEIAGGFSGWKAAGNISSSGIAADTHRLRYRQTDRANPDG